MAQNEYVINFSLNPVSQNVSSPTDASSENSSSGVPSPAAGNGQNNQEQAAQKAKKDNAAKAIAIQMVGRISSTALNNFGNISGNYVAQQNMQTLVGEATSIAGAVAMGPVGIAAYVGGKLLDGYNYISQLKKSEAESQFKQKRVYAATTRS